MSEPLMRCAVRVSPCEAVPLPGLCANKRARGAACARRGDSTSFDASAITCPAALRASRPASRVRQPCAACVLVEPAPSANIMMRLPQYRSVPCVVVATVPGTAQSILVLGI
jgi:hypothetical protein